MAEDFDPKEYRRKLKEERKRLKQMQKDKKAEMKRRRKEMKLAKIRMKEAALSGHKPAPSAPVESAPSVPLATQPETSISVPPAPSAVNPAIPWVKRSRLSIGEIEMRVDAIDVGAAPSLEERLDSEHRTLFDLYAKRFGEELELPSEYKDKNLLLDVPSDTDADVEIRASKDSVPSGDDNEDEGKTGSGVMSKIKSIFSRKKEEE